MKYIILLIVLLLFAACEYTPIIQQYDFTNQIMVDNGMGWSGVVFEIWKDTITMDETIIRVNTHHKQFVGKEYWQIGAKVYKLSFNDKNKFEQDYIVKKLTR